MPVVSADSTLEQTALIAELDRILADGAVRAAYQPIVDIETGGVVAYEALARGPVGSPLERPDHLFATAAAAGRTVELDWVCRIAAVRGALAARLGRGTRLFINCEPTAIDAPCPTAFAPVWKDAIERLDIVLEITERAVTAKPAELSRVVAAHRAAGRGIALDDLGADMRSLALLPFLEPDVIKLDLRLVQEQPSAHTAAIVTAVGAERERSGAIVLAEGIETEQHLLVALALGATHGQGWFWGRPGPLPVPAGPATTTNPIPVPLAPAGRHRSRPGDTPFDVVAADRPTRIASKALLLPISHHLEHQAAQIGEGAVLLSAFQHAQHFTRRTVRRYLRLAEGASLVGALGVDLDPTPCAGVRGAHIGADDPLAGEWSVVVLGPHFAGALVARDLGDTGADADRRFEFAIVYDRDLVIAAARTLLERITPV